MMSILLEMQLISLHNTFWSRLWHVFEIKLLINGNAKFVEICQRIAQGWTCFAPKISDQSTLLFA